MTENRENETKSAEIRTETPETTTRAAGAETPEKSETVKPKGNYKTIQQLAHEYGMSKNGIMSRLAKLQKEIEENNLDESDYISRGLKNTIYVLEPGLIWFARYSADNSPMQAISVSPEVQKLKNTEEINEQLKSEIEILKEQLKYLQQDLKSKDEQLTAKDNQITGLTATVAQQSKTLDTQLNQILALTAPKEDPGTSEAPKNEPGTTETNVSTSEDELRAELSKKSFWGKMKLLFS